jgi:hypothetical protein
MHATDLLRSKKWVMTRLPTEAVSLRGLQATPRAHTDDSWGEREARLALTDVGHGGRLYSFDEIFG